MKKRTIILAALAAALISTAGIGSAHAYFTTYAQAQGGHVLSLGDRTEVHEEFANWTKQVTITSDADSEPVYIRAKAFGPAEYPLEYSGDGWTTQPDSDGWYYYNSPVNGGESTSALQVQITKVSASEANAFQEGDNFNVVIVYESTPVRYHEDGSPYADWDAILDSGQVEGGGN